VPELPEVETVRRGMVSFVVGRRIERVEVGRERTVRRTSREALVDGLTGATVTSIGRRGKYILCSLDTGETLMIHLRMSGRVLVSPARSLRPDHTHVVLHFTGAPEQELWFVDPRTFGEMVVFDPARVADELPELAKLGIDPVTDGLTASQLTALLRRRARQLKPLLLDQHVIAGIGNIYCDEILHRARLRPDRLANTLKPADIRRLHDAIHSILSAAIEAGGSTLSDTQYVDVMGDGGSFQLDHRVYDRAGQRCLTCGRATIVRTVSGGRSTCFCPRCQH
jgi:formamidopyrimidine-DNA glycosylase